MLILAILTGAAALFNYYAVTAAIYPLLLALMIQLLLFVVTMIAVIGYRGRRNRPSYDGAGYSIWTVSFAIMMVSLLGNLAILVVLFLNQLHILSGF